jgi:hypothetical protein
MPKRRKPKPKTKLKVRTPVAPIKTRWDKISSLFTKTIFWIVTFLALIGAYPTYKFIKNEFKSPEEKYYDEMFISSIVIPPEVNYQTNLINIKAGLSTISFTMTSLMSGINYRCPFDVKGADGKNVEAIPLHFKIYDNKLYVSCIFRDLDNGEIIGEIKDNELSLLKSNILRFQSFNDGFEVVDKEGNVAMSLFFSYPNNINIQGYFSTREVITVVSNELAMYKRDELKSLDSIKSIISKIPHRGH